MPQCPIAGNATGCDDDDDDDIDRTSTRVISLKEVSDRLPVAANAYHNVTVDGSHEVRLLPL